MRCRLMSFFLSAPAKFTFCLISTSRLLPALLLPVLYCFFMMQPRFFSMPRFPASAASFLPRCLFLLSLRLPDASRHFSSASFICRRDLMQTLSQPSRASSEAPSHAEPAEASRAAERAYALYARRAAASFYFDAACCLLRWLRFDVTSDCLFRR